MSVTDTRDAAEQTLLATLAAADLEVAEVGERRYMAVLAGQWKRTIPVLFHIDERSLVVTSLFTGVPDEGHAEVYGLLLHKNQRRIPVHFALDDEGDVIITGHLPLEVVDVERLDGLLGALLLFADETFNQVLRAGFATYIEAEQGWRARNGLPPNPVSTEG